MIQAISLVGAALILFAFGAQQLGKLSSRSLVYALTNLFGSAALTIVGVAERNAGFIILEGVWALVSLRSTVLILAGRAPR